MRPKALMARHAGNLLSVVGLIFAAGVFTGIRSGTNMVDAIAERMIQLVPASLGAYLCVVTGVLSVPFTCLRSNDAFYFGVLPSLAKADEAYRIFTAEMAGAGLHLGAARDRPRNDGHPPGRARRLAGWSHAHLRRLPHLFHAGTICCCQYATCVAKTYTP